MPLSTFVVQEHAVATAMVSPESADVVVLARGQAHVLHLQPRLLELHDLGVGVGWPVLVTLGRALLDDSVEHDDGAAALLPHHRPEVRRGGGQRALGQDVAAVHRLHAHQARVDVVRGGHGGQRHPAVVVRVHIAIPGTFDNSH